MNFDDLIKGINADDRLLRPKEAAEFLNLAAQTLSVWRYLKNKGRDAPDLPYRKVGRRSIRYRLSDLKAFVEVNGKADGAAKDSCR